MKAASRKCLLDIYLCPVSIVLNVYLFQKGTDAELMVYQFSQEKAKKKLKLTDSILLPLSALLLSALLEHSGIRPLGVPPFSRRRLGDQEGMEGRLVGGRETTAWVCTSVVSFMSCIKGEDVFKWLNICGGFLFFPG